MADSDDDMTNMLREMNQQMVRIHHMCDDINDDLESVLENISDMRNKLRATITRIKAHNQQNSNDHEN